MDERDKRRVGEEIEPGGRPKAPGRLGLLQRFVNTGNHEFPFEWDRLGTERKAHSWLVAKGLVPEESRITAREAAELRDLREAIRELAVANRGAVPSATTIELIRHASARATLYVDVTSDGRTSLEPQRSWIPRVIATIVGILHEAQVTGDWPRFKVCRQCGYGFYDRSKNRSAVWCAMSICGNRTKNRAYRRRAKRGVGGARRRWTDTQPSA